MKNDQMLRLWGEVYGKKDRPRPRETVLSRVAVDRSRQQYTRERLAWARATGPRAYRAAGHAIPGHRVAPAWSCDPVRCSDDSGRFRGLADDPRETPELRAVQDQWAKLARDRPELAAVLAAEYQGYGTQRDKADRLGVAYRTYKHRLREARGLFYQ